MTLKVVTWSCRIIASLILLQTLFFKFSGAEESIYIFTAMHMEPWGRYLTGIAELVAAVMLLMPRVSVYGAIIGAAIMKGAISAHIFVLGIEVMGDGGLLFVYGCIVLICCMFLIYKGRHQLTKLLPKKLSAQV